MEVPPGRVERILDGGPDAIRSILAELRAMKFNGLLKTSVFRGDTPSQGVLVLRRGDGVLAEHRSSIDVAGAGAVSEILKDATSARAQLEIRTYDYGHSAISIDQLQRSYPEAAVQGLGDPDQVLTHVIALEAAERDAYLQDLEARRDQEETLVNREEELYRKKWELEQEYERSAIRQKQLESLRAELRAVKEASGMILRRLEERGAAEDVEVQSQRKLLSMEAERARAELETGRRILAERLGKAADVGRQLKEREALFSERESTIAARETSLEQERTQMNDLYAGLQIEMKKIAEARGVFDARLAEAEAKERDLIPREQAFQEWEERLRQRDASISERETALGQKAENEQDRLRDFSDRETSLRATSAEVAKQAESLAAHEVSLDDRREELALARKRLENIAEGLVGKDQKVASQEREVREREVDLRRGQRDLANRDKEMERRERHVAQTEEELSASRTTLKAQALKLLRSERITQERSRSIDASERDLKKRDASTKRRESAIGKRELALRQRSDRIEAERKRREAALATKRKAVQDRAAKVDSLKAQLAIERAAIRSSQGELNSRETKLMEREAQAEKVDSDVERRRNDLLRIKEGLRKIE